MFRRSSMNLAAGPCWWIRPQGIRHFYMIAESYGGEDLRFLVRGIRAQGKLVTSPPEVTARLNNELRQFGRNLHPLARPQPRRISHVHSGISRKAIP